jgi:hypothetical protein
MFGVNMCPAFRKRPYGELISRPRSPRPWPRRAVQPFKEDEQEIYFLKVNSGTVYPFPSTSFPIHYLLIILPLEAIQPCQLKASLNKPRIGLYVVKAR